MLFTSDQLALFSIISRLASDMQLRVCLIGGVLRDLYYGLTSRDFDFVVEGDALKFAEALAEKTSGEVREFENFLTAKVFSIQAHPTVEEVDLASSRKEIYTKGGALPQVSPASLEEDFRRRDFTINAVAVEIKTLQEALSKADLDQIWESCIDPLGGLTDLKNRCVRVLHPQSFLDDPTRIFRAVRYEQRINGKIEQYTEALIRQALAAGALNTISEVRKLNELRWIIEEPKAALIMQRMAAFGIFKHWTIISESNLTAITKAVAKLELVTQDQRFDAVLRIIFFYLSALELDQKVKDFNFPKKYTTTLLNDLRILRGAESISALSSAGSLVAFLRE